MRGLLIHGTLKSRVSLGGKEVFLKSWLRSWPGLDRLESKRCVRGLSFQCRYKMKLLAQERNLSFLHQILWLLTHTSSFISHLKPIHHLFMATTNALKPAFLEYNLGNCLGMRCSEISLVVASKTENNHIQRASTSLIEFKSTENFSIGLKHLYPFSRSPAVSN